VHGEHAADEHRVTVTVIQTSCFMCGSIHDFTEASHRHIAVGIVGYVAVTAVGGVIEPVGVAVKHRYDQGHPREISGHDLGDIALLAGGFSRDRE